MYINQEVYNGSNFEEDDQQSTTTTNSSPSSSNSSGSTTTIFDTTNENISQRLHEKFYGNNIRERRRKGLYKEKTAKEILLNNRRSKRQEGKSFGYYNFSKEIEKTGEKTVPFEYETITTNNYTNKKEELSENEKLWNKQQSHTIPRTSINQSTDIIGRSLKNLETNFYGSYDDDNMIIDIYHGMSESFLNYEEESIVKPKWNFLILSPKTSSEISVDEIDDEYISYGDSINDNQEEMSIKEKMELEAAKNDLIPRRECLEILVSRVESLKGFYVGTGHHDFPRGNGEWGCGFCILEYEVPGNMEEKVWWLVEFLGNLMVSMGADQSTFTLDDSGGFFIRKGDSYMYRADFNRSYIPPETLVINITVATITISSSLELPPLGLEVVIDQQQVHHNNNNEKEEKKKKITKSSPVGMIRDLFRRISFSSSSSDILKEKSTKIIKESEEKKSSSEERRLEEYSCASG